MRKLNTYFERVPMAVVTKILEGQAKLGKMVEQARMTKQDKLKQEAATQTRSKCAEGTT